MNTKLQAQIDLKHQEKLSPDDISNIEYFMKEGIEQIIDGSQDFVVESIKVSPSPSNKTIYEIL